MKRAILTVLGVVGVVVGVVMMVDPGVAALVGIGRGALIVVAVIALVQAYRTARGRRATPVTQAETPDPETEQDLPVPGEDVDEMLDRFDGRNSPPPGATPRDDRGGRVRNWERLGGRLERAAVETIVRKSGCTRAEAMDHLEAGTWTDDPLAAAFFTGDLSAVPRADRVRLRLSGESEFRRRAVHAAHAIAALSASDSPNLPTPPEVSG